MELQQSEKPNKPKKWVVLCAVIMTIVVVITCVSLVRCPQLYTTKQHIRTITRLANKRYVKSGEYDSLTVYPLYDENDKVNFYFLVELSPSSYVIVARHIPLLGTLGQYIRSDIPVEPAWRRYRICVDGNELLPDDGREWKADPNATSDKEKNYRYETDDNGSFIEYTSSPYAVAGVLDQKMYLLYIDGGGFVPAIKQGAFFLNLLSMETFEYSNEVSIDNTAYMDLGLHIHSSYEL